MADHVTELARLAAEVCMARNRATDDHEKRALSAELQRYVTMIAYARGKLSLIEAEHLLQPTDLELTAAEPVQQARLTPG